MKIEQESRSNLVVPHLGLPTNSNVMYIYTSLKSTFSAQQFPSWQCASIFIRLAVVGFQTCQLAQNSEKISTYSSSRSSKVDAFCTNRKRICKFLALSLDPTGRSAPRRSRSALATAHPSLGKSWIRSRSIECIRMSARMHGQERALGKGKMN